MMEINSGKCVLRTWDDSDIELLPEILNNQKILANLRDIFPKPYMKKDARDWIALNKSKKPSENLVISFNDQLIGGIGLKLQENVHRISAEIGYYLSEKFWGKGIMTDAVLGMTKYGFETFPINRIFGGVYSSNPSSIRVLEKCGYSLDGIYRQSIIKNDEILNEHIYSILKHEFYEQNNS